MYDPHVKRRARALPPSEKVWEQETRLEHSPHEDYKPEVARKLQVWRREGVVSMACHEKICSVKRRKATKAALAENPYAVGEPYEYYAWVRRWSLSVHLHGPSVTFYGMEYGKKSPSVQRLNGVLGLHLLLRATPAHAQAFLQAAEEEGGRRLFRDTHPLLPTYAPALLQVVEKLQEGEEVPEDLLREGRFQLTSLPTKEMLPALQEEDPRLVVERLFGKRHRRKDMTKALLQAHPRHLEVARAFRGLVVTDHLVSFLRAHPREGETRKFPRSQGLFGTGSSMGASFPVEEVRRCLKMLDERSLPALLRSPLGQREFNLLLDVPRMVRTQEEAFMGAYVRSWEQLHDLPQEARRRRDAEADRRLQEERGKVAIEFTPHAEALHEAQAGPFTLRCPSNGGELWEWGNTLHNCMGSYLSAASSKRTTLAGIFQEESLVGALEVQKNGELRQMLRKRNAPFEAQERRLLEEALASRGVQVDVNYWGRQA